MLDEVETIAFHEDVNRVVSLMLQGNNATQIARTLKMKRALVLEYITYWKQRAGDNKFIQEQAQVAVTSANEHFSMAIKEFWDIADQAENNGDLKLRKDSVMSAVVTEEKRVSMMQKAGLLSDQDLQNKIQQQKKREAEIVSMLKEVAREHPEVRATILGKLARITDEGVGIES